MTDRFVFFDLGMVLVRFDHNVAAQKLADLAGCSAAEAKQAIFGSGLEDRYETGLVTSSQFAQELNTSLNCTLTEDAILEATSAIFEPHDEILAALEHIRNAGVPMGILSNTCHGHWHWLQQRRWPMLVDWFELNMLSYELKCMKPNPVIYQLCEQHCGRRGSRIFFTDDRLENVRAAAEIGWSTYQFGTPSGLIAAFDQWLARVNP